MRSIMQKTNGSQFGLQPAGKQELAFRCCELTRSRSIELANSIEKLKSKI
ncbi:MAG: hypothetical protein HC849_05745 [Oscillatoriales cyanobacterium RU_3_3]|nr:hypothetical protein [Microcoleus sp. SM1_3_4]NJM59804.1 hypothetical protein [Oscillatoriales cyanobacterium RU_3_3]NJS42234.1 hypothetical protein [Candidatus Gracilibacteria bacterium]